MNYELRSELVDAVNLYLGQIITMTVHLLETFTSDFLKDEHFVAFKVAYNGCLYGGTIDVGLAYGNLSVVVFEHHGVKRNLATFVVFETVYEDFLILHDLELLA